MGKDMLSTMKYISTIPFSGLFNWSVQYLSDSKIAFNKAYPMMRIGEFLKRNKTAISIQDGTRYKRVTIRMRNGGVVPRDEVMGENIGTKKQFLVSEGQFILSKIDARNGAMGIIPKVLDGAVVTQDFLSYDIDTTKVNPQYFVLVCTTKQFIEFCQSCSSGTTNRQRIDEAQFLNIKVPVPSIEEQNKLVENYNNIINESHIRFSKGLIKARETRAYLSECIGVEELHPNGTREEVTMFDIIQFHQIHEWSVEKILSNNIYVSTKYKTINLNSNKSLYMDIKRGKSPKYAKESNVFILNQKCIRWGTIDIQYAKKIDHIWLESISKEYLTQEGDILINSTGEGTIGRSVVVNKDNVGLLYDSHILLLRLNKNYVDPQYFVHVFNSSYGQDQVNYVKSAKTTKQTELGIENLKRILIPIPPIEIQHRIAQKLTIMKKKVENLQQTDEYYLKAISNFESQIFE
ncbi:restriction endonuclease subunit S [uncultured Bacteroides sp.]|uniref:restriction endonuclease subunit S n=1 Tax=uncultured Bacteroides sp. TaxID=162156 RepID=UPI002611F651|nr:restriction endonuclease subunit S [uncultured Bacteroides sp.]